jgi:hypothetical protein
MAVELLTYVHEQLTILLKMSFNAVDTSIFIESHRM